MPGIGPALVFATAVMMPPATTKPPPARASEARPARGHHARAHGKAPNNAVRMRRHAASVVCVTSIEALTHNAMLHHAKTFSADTMDALVDEAVRLVMGYLKR